MGGEGLARMAAVIALAIWPWSIWLPSTRLVRVLVWARAAMRRATLVGALRLVLLVSAPKATLAPDRPPPQLHMA